MKSDRANVCTLASALINSQPLSALPRLHFKIPNRVSALPCLHLKIANQSGCLHFRVWKNPDYQWDTRCWLPRVDINNHSNACLCLRLKLNGIYISSSSDEYRLRAQTEEKDIQSREEKLMTTWFIFSLCYLLELLSLRHGVIWQNSNYYYWETFLSHQIWHSSPATLQKWVKQLTPTVPLNNK